MFVSTATLGRMTRPSVSLLVSALATSTTGPLGSVQPGSTSPAVINKSICLFTFDAVLGCPVSSRDALSWGYSTRGDLEVKMCKASWLE